MIRHQTIRHHPHPNALRRLLQNRLKRRVIPLIIKDRHPRVATVQNVIDMPPDINPW